MVIQGISVRLLVHAGVLVQREMESGRSLLASIQRFRGASFASFDGHRPM
jgi:hypothetical protein